MLQIVVIVPQTNKFCTLEYNRSPCKLQCWHIHAMSTSHLLYQVPASCRASALWLFRLLHCLDSDLFHTHILIQLQVHTSTLCQATEAEHGEKLSMEKSCYWARLRQVCTDSIRVHHTLQHIFVGHSDCKTEFLHWQQLSLPCRMLCLQLRTHRMQNAELM